MLREVIPTFQPSLGPVVDKGPLLRSKEPVVVSFRSGADLKEVRQAVSGNRDVLVDAGPSAGKSTRLPGELAQGLGALVVHVFPSVRLADHVHRYVTSQGQNAKILLKVEDEYPKQGIAMISAALVVAKWLAAGEVTMPECVLFHDESHECDAYTYLVKRLCLTSPAVRCRVSATATATATGFRSFEAKGQLTKGKFDEAVSGWDPYDEGKPWSINSLRGNAIMFVDSKSVAANLVETYASAGFLAYRLHSRMSLESFQSAMVALGDQNGPIVVLVVDSSFRSGYTMDVSTIVDSGKVGYMDVSTGRPVRRERFVYELEKVQTAARGARTPGSSTKFWFPSSVTPESAICDLAQVEMEAAALIFRILGYQVPRELDACVMARGDVPRELCVALQREQPLALLRGDQLVPISQAATPAGRRSPFLAKDTRVAEELPLDVVDPRVSADTARANGVQKLTKVSPPRSAWGESWQDDLQSLLKSEVGVREMKLGRAYYATGLETDQGTSMVFPDGADSVLRLMDGVDQHGALKSIGTWHKSVAVNLLLSRQAALAAEMDGIRRALKYAREDQGAAGTPAARSLAMRVAERLAVVSSSLNHVNDVLMKLGSGFCSFHEMEINSALSDSVFENWSVAWKSLPKSNNRGVLQSGFMVGKEGAAATKAVEATVRPRISDRPFVPMAGKGGGMRAIGSAMTALTSRSGSSSVASDERCTGSTYWSSGVQRDQHGRMAQVRRLVCEYCGPGASKRVHGL